VVKKEEAKLIEEKRKGEYPGPSQAGKQGRQSLLGSDRLGMSQPAL
jgi:hypothetical protein